MEKKASVLSVCCLLLVILSVFTVEDAKSGSTPSGHDLVIERVEVDFATNTLFIYGENFNNGTLPAVSLGGIPLAATLFSATEIHAALPDGIADGDYLLKITTGTSHPSV